MNEMSEGLGAGEGGDEEDDGRWEGELDERWKGSGRGWKGWGTKLEGQEVSSRQNPVAAPIHLGE